MQSPLDEILTLGEAADELDIDERDARSLIDSGALDAAKIGGRWLVSRASVAEVSEELDAQQDQDDDGDEDDDGSGDADCEDDGD